MIKIAPSILSADFAHLGRDIQRISDADYVHVDVMDGLFVPNISIGIPVVKCIRPVTDLPLDVHLMIDRPVRYVEQFCDAGGDLITCHVEADTEENIHSAIVKIHAKGKKAGVVVKPKTPASAVLPFINEVELILVMTVEPGFGGQRFMADMMPKVQEIRRYIDAMNPTCELEVDGGVDPATRDYIIHTILTNFHPDSTLLISTHLIADVERILDDVVFISRGQLVLHQSVDQIRQERGCSVDDLFREVFRYAE